jgi:hypothetical protein
MSENESINTSVPEPQKAAGSPLAGDTTQSAAELEKAARSRTPKLDALKRSQAAKAIPVEHRWTSRDEVTKPADIEALLELRGITPGHVTDIIIELGLNAARMNKIPANNFYWMNGLAALQQSRAAHEAVILNAEENKIIPGELIKLADLKAIYDYGESWRDDKATFEEFLAHRRRSKLDLMWFTTEILGKDFQDVPHRAWAEMFPAFTGEILDSLKPGFTQKELKKAFNDIAKSSGSRRALIASRGSMKSSFAICWLVQMILCAPAIRALWVSEAKHLVQGFVRSLRSYWEVEKYAVTKMQRLFPEYCVPAGSGSALNFQSPMNHLTHLVEHTVESTSMDSQTTGSRANVICFEDVCSYLNVNSQESRDQVYNRYKLLLKLLEAGGALGGIVVGTPWHKDDLLGRLLKEEEESPDPEHPLIWRVDPIFTVKSQAIEKSKENLWLLEEADVDILPIFDWAHVRSEMKEGRKDDFRIFKMQNLCSFEPEVGEADRVVFTEADLKAHIKGLEFFQPMNVIETVMSLDISYVPSKHSDFSCLIVGKIIRQQDDHRMLLVSNTRLGRWKMSETALEVAKMVSITGGSLRLVLEKTGAYMDLRDQIVRACQQLSVPCPFMIFKATNLGGANAKSKAARIKSLEPLLANNQLWFLTGIADLEQGLSQMVSFDGISKSYRIKNDFPDALSLLATTFFIRNESEEKTKADEEEEERQRQAMVSAAHYAAVFGESIPTFRPSEPELSSRGQFGIPGLRSGNSVPSSSDRITFGSIARPSSEKVGQVAVPPSSRIGFGSITKKS